MISSRTTGFAWLQRRLGLHEEAERQYWGLLLPLFLLTLFSWIDHPIMVPLVQRFLQLQDSPRCVVVC